MKQLNGKKIGHIESAIRRAWIENRGKPLSTVELMRRVYPGARAHWQYLATRRAARKFAIAIGPSERGRGKSATFRPKPELMRLIRGH